MGDETKSSAGIYQIGPEGINTLAAVIAKETARAVTEANAGFLARLEEIAKLMATTSVVIPPNADLPDDFRSGSVRSDCGEKVAGVPTPCTREHSYQWIIGRLSGLVLLDEQRIVGIVTGTSEGGSNYPDLPAGLTVSEIVRRLERSTSFSNALCLLIADALVEPPAQAEVDDEPMAGETSRQIEEADDWLRDAYRLAYVVGILANPNTPNDTPWCEVISKAHSFAEQAVSF